MPKPSHTIREDWFAETFDTLYPIVYAHRTIKAAGREAAFAAEHVGLRDTDMVLDLACGNGRHLHHLAEKTRGLVGMDYSAFLLRHARACLSERTLLVRADMRQMPFRDCFTVVMNFFTSFGYFANEDENLAVLEGVSRALKAGARLFIDYVNAEYVEQTLQPESVRMVDGIEILETRWIDHQARRVNKSTRLQRGGKILRRLSESVRLYRPWEFEELLRRHGLMVDKMFGDYSGVPLAPAYPRMIIVGHKAV